MKKYFTGVALLSCCLVTNFALAAFPSLKVSLKVLSPPFCAGSGAGNQAAYEIKATASGGNGTYNFNWKSGTELNNSSDNPNSIFLVVGRYGGQAQVTVTSGDGQSKFSFIDVPNTCNSGGGF